MTFKLAVIMDPINKTNTKKDSTLAMLREASKRQWELVYFEQGDLFSRNGDASGIGRPLTLKDAEQWYELADEQEYHLGDFDFILMRKDPPFDMNYIYTTYLLERAEQAGAIVVNKPQSLRDCNEKFFATSFPQCCPPLLVSQRADLLREFIQTHKDVVIKPLDGMGGESIFRVKGKDENTSVIIETLTQHESRPVMAQQYIPEISNGDKRILLIDGKPVPYALARVPAEGELRGNLAAGGSGVGQALTERDYWICEQLAPTLIEKGLIFVGIDVIGDCLTEVNVTSPTCIREIDRAFETNIAALLLDALELRVLD
ncbi:MAG: glutathione synthase [Pseudomonadales bacterium]|nr:glutathione synthase [Pseudomonadales bacterium]